MKEPKLGARMPEFRGRIIKEERYALMYVKDKNYV